MYVYMYMQAVAVDKGAGWGEFEGRAIVFSKPVYFHSRPFMKKPTPEEMARRRIADAYPPQLCRYKEPRGTRTEKWNLQLRVDNIAAKSSITVI